MAMPDQPAAPARDTAHSFRLLVDGVRDYAIFMLDGAGRVLTWNTGAQRLKAYGAEEIIGKHFSCFYPEEAVEAGKPARLLALAARDGRVEDEGWLVRRDGSRFWADVIITALRDSDGSVIGFAKVTRDLTEQRRADQALHESEERFRLLVESVKDYAIFMLDPAGRVVSWNAGAEAIKGYAAEDILGQHFSVFYPPEAVARGEPQAHLDVALREGRLEDEGWRVRKDGSRFWADAIITAIRDAAGVLIGFGKVTRDLTVRRRMEDQLAQSNAELERFSYSVSHDLRAPLRAINGYAQAVLEDSAAALDAEGQRHLGIIRDSAKRGGELIDALLNFSRLGRQTLSVEPVDLTELARSVVDELRKAAGTEQMDTIVDPLPPTKGDRTLLRQVFANLVGNAFKFSRGRPHPQIEIGARRESNAVVYYVKDNGVGFDMRYADKLFGVFQRLHRADEFEGTGVGLALAQRIIQRHGGRIWADAKVDGGATLFFTLPAGPPVAP
ncbi:MAG TPA: PAS domain S-box protein [Gemmatimonadales bacterium]|nr:PAS domain S-box protein [Gemmatimonadales bacterium]